MVIRELKPSQHREGRWLAVLEDGSILRLGEGEVVDFALFAGKELTGEEGEALQQAALRGKRREKALELLARKPQSRRGYRWSQISQVLERYDGEGEADW